MKNLILLGLCSISVCAMETQLQEIHVMKIPASCLVASQSLKKVKLYNDGNNFFVSHNKILHKLPKHDLDKTLRHITPEQIKEFVKGGYFSLHQQDDGSFILKSNSRGLGGGPITGQIFYWGTKGIIYAGMAVMTAVAGKKLIKAACDAGINKDVADAAVNVVEKGAMTIATSPGAALVGSTLAKPILNHPELSNNISIGTAGVATFTVTDVGLKTTGNPGVIEIIATTLKAFGNSLPTP